MTPLISCSGRCCSSMWFHFLSVDDHHFPGAIPVSAGRRVSREASQVRFT